MGTNLTTYEALPVIPDNSLTIDPKQNFYEFKVRKIDVHNFINIVNVKEVLYSDAITNLMKKSKFLQLYIQLIEEQISEDEYEKELNENPANYFINMKEVKSNLEYAALFQVMQNLPKDITLDEVSEIFGIKTHSMIQQQVNF